MNVITWDTLKYEILDMVMKKAMDSARKFAGERIDITYYLFDFDSNIVMQKQSRGVFCQ